MSEETLPDKLKYWRETKRAPGRLRRKGTTNTTPVIAHQGVARGQVVGTHTEHWDDHVDAHAYPPPIILERG